MLKVRFKQTSCIAVWRFAQNIRTTVYFIFAISIFNRIQQNLKIYKANANEVCK